MSQMGNSVLICCARCSAPLSYCGRDTTACFQQFRNLLQFLIHIVERGKVVTLPEEVAD